MLLASAFFITLAILGWRPLPVQSMVKTLMRRTYPAKPLARQLAMPDMFLSPNWQVTDYRLKFIPTMADFGDIQP